LTHTASFAAWSALIASFIAVSAVHEPRHRTTRECRLTVIHRIAGFGAVTVLPVRADGVVRRVITLIRRLVARIRGAGDTVTATGGVPAWQSFNGSHVSAPSQNWPLLHAALFGA